MDRFPHRLWYAQATDDPSPSICTEECAIQWLSWAYVDPVWAAERARPMERIATPLGTVWYA